MDQSDVYKRRLAYLEDRALRRAYFAERISNAVTPDTVKAAYDEYVKSFQPQEEVRASHILVATRQEAVDLRARLDKGEPFVELAKQISKDTDTAKKGGDLGWISPRDVPQGWEKVLSLDEGQVSEPLQSKFGWHLVLVTKIQPPQPLAFEAVKMDLQKKLLLDRRKAEDDYKVNVKAELEIELLHQKIDALREGEVQSLTRSIETLTRMLSEARAEGGKAG